MITRPTVEELTLVQRYVDRVRDRARDRNLKIHLDNDAGAFVRFLSAQRETHGVSSIHDPEHSFITPDRFLWMRIDDGNRGVCCHAIRMIETDDLISEVLTWRVFADLDTVWNYRGSAAVSRSLEYRRGRPDCDRRRIMGRSGLSGSRVFRVVPQAFAGHRDPAFPARLLRKLHPKHAKPAVMGAGLLRQPERDAVDAWLLPALWAAAGRAARLCQPDGDPQTGEGGTGLCGSDSARVA